MPRYSALIVVAAVAALCGAGCTVIGQYRENQVVGKQVKEKEADVKLEEARQAELRNQMNELSSELANRKLTARQLDDRLAALQKRTGELVATNGQQRQLLTQARAELGRYRAQLAALERAPRQDDRQIEAQIAALKEEIRKRLRILAAAE